MANSLVRRNSGKQGLQNLMRLTAQRSVEDAEEVEREHRRRTREFLRRRDSGSAPEESSLVGKRLPEDNICDDSLKASNSPSLEEDEGFSDWTQRRERRRQQRRQELSREDEEDEVDTANQVLPVQTAMGRLQRKEKEETDSVTRGMVRNDEKEKVIPTETEERKMHDGIPGKSVKIQRPNQEVEKRKEVKVSYTSKVFLKQELKDIDTDGTAATANPTRHSKTSRSSSACSRTLEREEADTILETEQQPEKMRRCSQEKESKELQQLRYRQADAEQELELKKREERRRDIQEEERRREEEEQQRMAKDQVEKRWLNDDLERRRMEAAERMKSLNTCKVEGEASFCPSNPKVPTHKITERTESLNRSLKKSNSFKKTQPLVVTSKIDDKLELYVNAVENSDSRAVKASLPDLPNSPEVVTSKKNLFEAGEAWSSTPSRGASCKEAEGLKVGVASLITQWVRNPSDGISRQVASKPADVKSGDVMQKKNLWEGIGDSSRRAVKAPSVGKMYTFVVTGHGKYEKIPADNENGKGELVSESCREDY